MTDDTIPDPDPAAARSALDQGRTAIDVRTPEEYTEGHVDGAQLIDVQGPDFDSEIAALPTTAAYVVYCRSGKRAGMAAERMSSAGLEVLNGGGLDDMTNAGWPTSG